MQKSKKHPLRLACAAAALIIGLYLAPAALAADTRELVPMGTAVGIELKTPGAVVVGLENIEGKAGTVSPARDAGVAPGDLIVKLGNEDVGSAADFLSAAAALDGSQVSLTVKRGEKTMQFTLSPEKLEDGAKLGLWIRDSVTGVGTMTFYDPATGVFGALGHPISDTDTNIIMPLGSGSIMDATIVDVHTGQCGKPGELRGVFDLGRPTGSIQLNSDAGIFGVKTETGEAPARDAIPIASQDEVKIGRAVILSSISGSEVSEFEIEITRIYNDGQPVRSLMLKVTDEKLLADTGGIVQGMSGSPIIQNGKLVGAVTHVLVNDPTRGYGILIDAMLDECESSPQVSVPPR
jgi:stage IV sporulation protein B